MKLDGTIIAINCSKSFEFLQLGEIIRFEGLQNYTKLYLNDGKTIISTDNLGSFKQALENSGFYSCHKSHLINEKHIVRYNKDGFVTLSDESSVPVSRRKRQDFVESVVQKHTLAIKQKIAEMRTAKPQFIIS